jgi:flagellar hook assembly protein FlgD
LRFLPPRPNPVAQSTRFAFELPASASVSLEIFDVGGRRVAGLVSGEYGAGRHELTWGASDDHGARVSGGLYFARFRARGLDRIERLIVLP